MKLRHIGQLFIALFLLSADALATTHTVTFVCCAYSPTGFSASVGDTVVWQGDFTMHPLESTTIPSGAPPFSQGMGSSFSYVIQVAGNYDYHCLVHQPTMSGSFDVITASVDDRNKTSPNSFMLYQNFPNPFNPATQISFYVPTAQSITIKLFDLLGNEVTTLVDGKISAGVHSVQFDGNRLSSGIYLYKLEAVDFVEVKKLVLIK